MSASKFYVELSKPAREDFRDILNYTVQLWGKEQAEIYADILNDALHTIASSPKGGSVKTKKLRVFIIKKHKIFYRINKNKIYIVRILHSRMNEVKHI